MNKQIATFLIGSDHAGYDMKEHIKRYLTKCGIPFEDASSGEFDPLDDYTEHGFKVAAAIAQGEFRQGILICGTGIGISIAANRYRGVRAALCASPEFARMAREHNDANILVIGGRTTTSEAAEKIIDAWVGGQFQGGRHQKRVDLLDSVGKSC